MPWRWRGQGLLGQSPVGSLKLLFSKEFHSFPPLYIDFSLEMAIYRGTGQFALVGKPRFHDGQVTVLIVWLLLDSLVVAFAVKFIL